MEFICGNCYSSNLGPNYANWSIKKICKDCGAANKFTDSGKLIWSKGGKKIKKDDSFYKNIPYLNSKPSLSKEEMEHIKLQGDKILEQTKDKFIKPDTWGGWKLK